MRNYIILNGVNSNTITGLLISTLPPITKPKQRTQTEEIDGRDGDIVTKLGYSAYEKDIQIGLYGNFDIDEVIAYFNTEGTVIFSNEPDKFYNYQILDQIDYEKLIRFKTAKVKMHVQPFKYPTEETPVEINIQNVTGSGESITLNNTADAPLTLALKGNTSQNGTPTPDTPVEVEIVTGKQEINITNGTDTQSYEINLGVNNLFDYTKITSVVNGTNDNGVITQTGVNCTVWFNDRVINVKNGETIYFSCDIKLNNNSTGSFSNINDNVNANTNKILRPTLSTNYQRYQTSLTYTSDSTIRRILIQISSLNGSCEISNIQISKEKSPAFYPYGKIPIELCKIENYQGNYQDRIYKEINKWYIEKKIGKAVLNGSEDWSYGTSGGYPRCTLNSLSNLMGYTDTTRHIGRFICSHFTPNTANGTGNMYQYQNTILCNPTSDITSLATWVTWLQNNNVSLYYVLETPTTTEITDTELIGQLEAIKTARSNDPTTQISQNTTNKPFLLNATAVQKGTDTATVDNEGNIYSKPTIDIEGSGTANIYLNGNQIFSIDLSTINECIIDTTNLEAYNPTTNILMNRQVTGDYSNFKLNAGDNEVKISGAVTKATISNYTRWL